MSFRLGRSVSRIFRDDFYEIGTDRAEWSPSGGFHPVLAVFTPGEWDTLGTGVVLKPREGPVDIDIKIAMISARKKKESKP